MCRGAVAGFARRLGSAVFNGGSLDWTIWLRPEYLGLIGRGILVTLAVTTASAFLAMLLGLAWGLARTYGGPGLQMVAGGWIAIGRNVPAIVQVFFWAFAVPRLLPLEARQTWLFANQPVLAVQEATGVHLFYAAALTLGLAINTAGYLAEIVRAGCQSVPRPIIQAGLSGGLARRTVLVSIVAPLAWPIAAPAAINRLIHNFKNSSLAIFLPVPDLLSGVSIAISESFRAIEFLTLAALFYVLLTVALTRLGIIWERRYPAWPI